MSAALSASSSRTQAATNCWTRSGRTTEDKDPVSDNAVRRIFSLIRRGGARSEGDDRAMDAWDPASWPHPLANSSAHRVNRKTLLISGQLVGEASGDIGRLRGLIWTFP